jgi:hypothetical protein
MLWYPTYLSLTSGSGQFEKALEISVQATFRFSFVFCKVARNSLPINARFSCVESLKFRGSVIGEEGENRGRF